MHKFLQINLNCCKAAHALALQQAAESNVDILIVSEPPPTRINTWYYDSLGKATIACPRGLTVDIVGPTEPGFTWIQTGNLRIYSCYWSPRPDPNIAQFRAFLSNLEHSVITHNGDSIICGDFNAHHTSWGSRSNSSKGDAILDLIQSLGLVICNVSTSPTFVRGSGSSVIDITLASPRVAANISNWAVLDTITLSDHFYIQFTLQDFLISHPTRVSRPPKLHAPTLKALLSTNRLTVAECASDIDQMADNLSSAIYDACSLPPSNSEGKRRSVHWWSPRLGELRKTANHLRRVFQLKRRRFGPVASAVEEAAAKYAKLALTKAIKRAKDQAWKDLYDEVERDPWGKPYKIVMGKMKIRSEIPGLNLPGRLPMIIRELFPPHPVKQPALWPTPSSSPVRKVDVEELKSACSKLKSGTAPGPDGITNEILKILISQQPESFLDIANACLSQGRFP
ncbi:uncharacterized protein LOC132924737 [Rhopalosiphum padi]|uniref:uncharacterized protein LOC132924737 n=1 Tax=Rhopalosiphum padi TaxID=40932 RepID=UPI00298DD61E|nr:uncharacterized protein LOC132924737 [Rhopalosiphum padi]